MQERNKHLAVLLRIIGDPGAASPHEAIFSGEYKSTLILTKPVAEVFEFSPTDWPEKYFSSQ